MARLVKDDLPAVRRFLDHLNTARKRAKILPAEHRYVAEAIADIVKAFEELLRGRSSFTLSITNDEIYADGLFMPEESVTFDELVADFAERQLTSLTFNDTLDLREFGAFVSFTVLKRDTIDHEKGLEAALARHGVRHITLGRFAVVAPTLEEGGAGGARGTEDATVVPRDMYRAVVHIVVDTFIAASGRETLDLGVVDGMVQLLIASVMKERSVALGLNTMKSASEYTFYHSVNVAILSLLMGARLGLNETFLQRLGMAALLHDIGKMAIPKEILDKPGKLTDDEFAIMRNHTVEGMKILAGQNGVDDLAPVIAAQHHARFDLTGYPDFKPLGHLHIMSHLVTVADVYDALTSDRCYGKAMLPDRAMRIVIEGRGTLFHPLFAKVFIELGGMFPVGTLVQLDTGELAVVVEPNSADIYRPTVKLIVPAGSDATESERIDIAESHPDGTYPRSIVRSVDPEEQGVIIPKLI